MLVRENELVMEKKTYKDDHELMLLRNVPKLPLGFFLFKQVLLTQK